MTELIWVLGLILVVALIVIFEGRHDAGDAADVDQLVAGGMTEEQARAALWERKQW